MFFSSTTTALLFALCGAFSGANGLTITTVEQLITFSNSVNNGTSYYGSTVYLGSDIEFTSSLSNQFEPIGKTSNSYFNGTFDGQGHTISGLSFSASNYVGLFGYSAGATIKNVVINSSCTFSISNNNGDAGSIAGLCSSCFIENVVNMGKVLLSSSAGNNLYFGGIVGRLLGSNIIKNCANYGPVAQSGNGGNAYIGGIAGVCAGNGTSYIQNCANYGALSHTKNNMMRRAPVSQYTLYAGGILGKTESGTVTAENCLSAGNIRNMYEDKLSFIGSIVGHGGVENIAQQKVIVNTSITHCLWTKDVGCNITHGTGSFARVEKSDPIEDLSKITIDELNEYASKNSEWNKWLLNTNNYAVTFKVNDYKGFTLSSQVVLLPDLAGSDNRVFNGWFTDSGCSIPFTSNEVSDATALYGLYEVAVTVAFNGNGGTPSQKTKSVVFNKKYGTLPEGTRTGYRFAGWFTEEEEGQGERITEETIVSIGSDHTLYAHWTINNYTITFVFNNGTDHMMKSFNYNETIVYPEDVVKEGYTFNGWSPKPRRMPAYNLIISTQFKPNEYNVTFNPTGGYPEIPEKIVTYDCAYEDLPVPQRNGYYFVGWFTEGNPNEITESSIVKVAGNHVLYAKWTNQSYFVEFEGNNGTPSLASMKVYYDSKYGALPTAERTGYTFVGWFTDKTGSVQITNNDTVDIIENETFYAHWYPNNYTVSLIGNGGFVGDRAESTINVTYDSDYRGLPYPVRTGHTFLGWYTDTDTKVQSNAVVKITSDEHSFFAHWEANNYTVSFDTNGGTNIAKLSKVVTYNNTYGELPDASRIGHYFLGWYTNVSEGSKIGPDITFVTPGNQTLYAHWLIRNYTVSFIFENGTVVDVTLEYNETIEYPNENTKFFYEFKRWCSEDTKECNVVNVPPRDISFYSSFDLKVGVVSGIAAGSFLFVLLIIILIIIVIMLILIIKKGMKVGHESIDVEMTSVKKPNDDDDARILQQMEVTKLSTTDIEAVFASCPVDPNSVESIDEIIDHLDIGFDDNAYNGLESFKNTGVAAAIANAIQTSTGIAFAAEYLSILYADVRDQEEYQKFDKLYFGMKDLDDFLEKKEENISFGCIVSAFTDKKEVIRLLSEGEEDSLPRGVLFKVQRGMGYVVGELKDEIEEVLFEIDSVFKVETVNEVIKDRYIVVKVSFVSPSSKNEVLKF